MDGDGRKSDVDRVDAKDRQSAEAEKNGLKQKSDEDESARR